jgi:hypothetical protein
VLYLGIPAYNEATTIGVLLWRLRTVLADVSREYEVVVYDDASTDDTVATLAPYARVLPLTVLQGARRLGTGGAMDALVRHVARTTRYPRRDGLLLLQGDFTDPPAIVPEFLRRFEGGADLVIGERRPLTDAPQSVRRLHRAARWVLRPFVGITDVQDLTASIRLARISVLRDLLKASGDAPVASGDGWAAQADFLLRAAPHARRIETIPVAPTFGVRTRASRREAWPDALALAKWAWANRGRRVEAKVVARTVDAPADGHESLEELEAARPAPPERRERTGDTADASPKRPRRDRGERSQSGDGHAGERERTSRSRGERSRSERSRGERSRSERSERSERSQRPEPAQREATTIPNGEPSSELTAPSDAGERGTTEAPTRKKRRRSRRSGRSGDDGSVRDAEGTDGVAPESEPRRAREPRRIAASDADPNPSARSALDDRARATDAEPSEADADVDDADLVESEPADADADRPRARRRRARRGRRRRGDAADGIEDAPGDAASEHGHAARQPGDAQDGSSGAAKGTSARRRTSDEADDHADDAREAPDEGESSEAARARRRRNRRGRRGGRRRQHGDGQTGDIAGGDGPSGDGSPPAEHGQ